MSRVLSSGKIPENAEIPVICVRKHHDLNHRQKGKSSGTEIPKLYTHIKTKVKAFRFRLHSQLSRYTVKHNVGILTWVQWQWLISPRDPCMETWKEPPQRCWTWARAQRWVLGALVLAALSSRWKPAQSSQSSLWCLPFPWDQEL